MFWQWRDGRSFQVKKVVVRKKEHEVENVDLAELKKVAKMGVGGT